VSGENRKVAQVREKKTFTRERVGRRFSTQPRPIERETFSIHNQPRTMKSARKVTLVSVKGGGGSKIASPNTKGRRKNGGELVKRAGFAGNRGCVQ